MRNRIFAKASALSLALAASWPTWTWAQPALPPDKPLVPHRRDSRGSVCTLAGPGHHAGAVTFSPDGSTLFVGYVDGSIRRFDAKSGRQLGPTVENHMASIEALAVSPDGQGLAVAAPARNSSPLCDLVTIRRPVETEISEISRIPGRVIALAYAADGKTIGAIDDRYNIRVWRVEDRTEVSSSEDPHRADGRRPAGAVTRASFSADLKRAVIVNDADVHFKEGRWNHLVRLWEAGGKEQRIFGDRGGFESQPITCALASPDGSQFVVAHELHYVFYHDFASVRFLHGHSPGFARRGDDLTFLMLSPDNRRLVSAEKAGSVIVHDLNDKLHGRHGFAGPYGYVRAAAFVPNGVRFASGGWAPLGNEKIPGTDLLKYEPVLLWEVEVEVEVEGM